MTDCIHCRTLIAALRQIAKGEGRYSRNKLTHAGNTIDDMTAIALSAIEDHEKLTAGQSMSAQEWTAEEILQHES